MGGMVTLLMHECIHLTIVCCTQLALDQGNAGNAQAIMILYNDSENSFLIFNSFLMLQMSLSSVQCSQQVHNGLHLHRSLVSKTSLQKMIYSLPVDLRSSVIRMTLTWMKMVSVFI